MKFDGAPREPLRAVPMTEFASRKVEWLWNGRIPLGKLTILDGDPGMGKSVIANADIPARVSRGEPMPDGSSGLSSPRCVVLVVAEDDIGDTVRPRLEVAGADVSRVFTIGVKRDSKDRLIPLTIPDGLDAVRDAIIETDAALVVIDPITAFLDERVNSHNDASTRRALGPLKELAEETGAAVVMIRHLNKSGEAKALYRGGGSIAFSGSARSGLMVERLPDGEEWIALAQVKGNLSRKVKTLTYKVVSALDEGHDEDVALVVWGEASDLSADDLFAKKDARKNAPRREEAQTFLIELLHENPTPATEVKEAAKVAGLSWATVKTAADHIGVEKVAEREPDGKRAIKAWIWSLPGGLKWMAGRGAE